MNLPATIVLAIGLALDAFAVSVASGTAVRCRTLRTALRVALFFGGFQALMPLLGWLASYRFRSLIAGVNHWVAFGLLAFIGGKMIWEARYLDQEDRNGCIEDTRLLLLLALATSIDALVVGVSFSVMGIGIIAPALIIGGVTFIISFLGILLGKKFGHLFENRIEIIGGLILILLGLKILIEGLAG